MAFRSVGILIYYNSWPVKHECFIALAVIGPDITEKKNLIRI